MSSKLEMPQSVFAVIVITLLISSAFLAFAKDSQGLDLTPQGKNVLFGFIAGIVLALGGYLKNATPENFDPVKFIITLIIGMFTGLLMYYAGLDYSSAQVAAETYLINSGILAIVEVWLKTIVRRLSTI